MQEDGYSGAAPAAGAKHRLELSTAPNAASAICLRYLFAVSGGDFLISNGDTLDHQVTCLENGRAAAENTINVIYWLSFRNTPGFAKVGQLCGQDKTQKRRVGSAVKRVLGWLEDWSDLITPPEQQLTPTCAPILLDKRMRARGMHYITDYTINESETNLHASAADVLMLALLQPWLRACVGAGVAGGAGAAGEACDTAAGDAEDGDAGDGVACVTELLPYVLLYVQRIRAELRASDGPLFDRLFGELWVDGVQGPTQTVPVFRFTRRKVAGTGGEAGGGGGGGGTGSKGAGGKGGGSKEGEGSKRSKGAKRSRGSRGSAVAGAETGAETGADAGAEAGVGELERMAEQLSSLARWVWFETERVTERETEGETQAEAVQAVAETESEVVDAGEAGEVAESMGDGEGMGVGEGIGGVGGVGEVELWASMSLPPGREHRKRQQIESLLHHATALLPPNGVAVEFCAGGGFIGIPLAKARPDCWVLLTDMNPVSLAFAKQRVAALGLRNVRCLREELAVLEGVCGGGRTGAGVQTTMSPSPMSLLLRCDLGLALHACGAASDSVLRICRMLGAAFVVSPCCYGFIRHAVEKDGVRVAGEGVGMEGVGVEGDRLDGLKGGRLEGEGLEGEGLEGEDGELCDCLAQMQVSATPAVTGEAIASVAEVPPTLPASPAAPTPSIYPQSRAYRAAGWQSGWFGTLCSRADNTFWSHDSRAQKYNTAGCRAMRAIDSDRLLCCGDQGYEVFGTFMVPKTASVKNHILVGSLHSPRPTVYE